jgi:serine/threonine protein kinase
MDLKQRDRADNNPGAVVEELLREFLRQRGAQGASLELQGYADLKKIAEGGFGAVYKASRTRDGKIVAIKTMLQTRKPDRKKLLLFERKKRDYLFNSSTPTSYAASRLACGMTSILLRWTTLMAVAFGI